MPHKPWDNVVDRDTLIRMLEAQATRIEKLEQSLTLLKSDCNWSTARSDSYVPPTEEQLHEMAQVPPADPYFVY